MIEEKLSALKNGPGGDEYTSFDIIMLHALMAGFSAHTEKNPIKAKEIIAAMNKWLSDKYPEYQLTLVSLMKYAHIIRAKSLLPLIANSDGYFVSTNPKVIKAQIQSLNARANSIKEGADGLLQFLP